MSNTTTTVREQDYQDGYVVLGDTPAKQEIAIKRNEAGEIVFYSVQRNDDGTLTLTLLDNPPELDTLDLEQYSADELEELLDVLGAASGSIAKAFLKAMGSKNLGKLMQLVLANAENHVSGSNLDELKRLANLVIQGTATNEDIEQLFDLCGKLFQSVGGSDGNYSDLGLLQLQLAFLLIAMCSLTRKSQLEAVIGEIQKAMQMALAAKETAIKAAGEAKTAAIVQGVFAIVGGLLTLGCAGMQYRAAGKTGQGTTSTSDATATAQGQTATKGSPEFWQLIGRSLESITQGLGGITAGQYTYKEKMLEAEVKMLEYLAEVIRRVMTQVTEFASELKEMFDKFMQFIMSFLEAMAAVMRDVAGKMS